MAQGTVFTMLLFLCKLQMAQEGRVLYNTRIERPAMKNFSLLGTSVTKKMKCCEYDYRYRIHDTSFFC